MTQEPLTLTTEEEHVVLRILEEIQRRRFDLTPAQAKLHRKLVEREIAGGDERRA